MTTTDTPARMRSTFVHDTLVVFRRAMRLSLRNPVWTVMGLAQPVLYLALFGPLLEPLKAQLGVGNAYQFFVPGLLVQLGMFGAMFVGFGLIAEWRDGVIESERVTPAPRSALVLGRVLRDVVVIAVQGTVLCAVGYLFGLRAPFVGIVLGVLSAAMLGAAFASASYAVALTVKSEDALAPLLNGIALPLLLLSGILLPIVSPAWLKHLSDLNPLKHVVDGIRAEFLGELSTATSLWGYGLTIALVVVGVWFGTRTFRRENG
ncbi:daunorubicin/doxorubicin resistance ABC transporter permease protein DrrB [mine drainage metagenome]|uniref:Daunorubicin/doxorubicin resistance ABC transporter permease protein DrrB n=1 Tax=mine drainage metagenome TaxID=410659 RepID=A0A1J5RJY2_9ZZZZ